jgi:hypothetical protein
VSFTYLDIASVEGYNSLRGAGHRSAAVKAQQNMAAPLPAKLKAAAPDVQRFATRAAQLEKFRPIVSYWCMSEQLIWHLARH